MYLERSFLDIKSDFVVNNGDILIALSGATTGKFGLYKLNEPSLLNQRIGLIKSSDAKKIDSKYIYYYLFILKNEILRLAGGAAQPNISTKTIGEIKIPLPPLAIQKQIADALDRADAVRQRTKTILAQYDELLQATFLDMFGDPVNNPKGWNKVKLGDVGKLDRGKSKHRPRNAPELLGGQYPLIQTGDIANSKGYIYEFKSTYSELGLAQSKMWQKGTLCITIAANIAKTGILTFEACFPDSVVGFIPNEHTNNEYTQYWFMFLQKIIEDSAPESAQKNINLKILRNLDFMCPPISLQNKFATIVEEVEKQKTKIQKQQQEAEELFQSLMQKSFKGELFA